MGIFYHQFNIRIFDFEHQKMLINITGISWDESTIFVGRELSKKVILLGGLDLGPTCLKCFDSRFIHGDQWINSSITSL